ncbi:hypothetical protein [Moraxella nonliquefaciens]|uniref:Transposase n=1 Tax=Moraxella nonliquefaciens TaxID=478 RepID=A0A7T3F0X9_MORNO|nr:hypothetical protein [Moraxella nonliquefaciens]QPT44849.1 hypothetical protein I6G26_02080 [Moraxella nonliquefaciens]QQC29870.1 hypothetical protein I6H63_00810 [Moraxella nonliquefaciens]
MNTGNRAVVYSAKIDALAVALIRFGANPTHYLQNIQRYLSSNKSSDNYSSKPVNQQ